MQQQARLYRVDGIKLQNSGDLDGALKLFQKAIELDPLYPEVYNDLGIIYEAQGDPDRAEESYLQALRVDPHYLGAYSNLALFYEGKRDLAKATYYWKKRIELGDSNDPWTIKAQQRLDDILLALSQNPMAEIQKKNVDNLMKEVSTGKYTSKP